VPETTHGAEETQADQPEDAIADAAPGEGAATRAPEAEKRDGAVHRLRPDGAEATGRGGEAREGWRNLHRMLDLPLSLTVELGSTEMPLSEVLRLEGDSVITIDRMPGEPIDLLINGRVFARGEVVVINETFGCRITELVDDAESTLEIGRDGG